MKGGEELDELDRRMLNFPGELTEAQLAEFKRRWEQAMAKRQSPRILGLPLRTRLRWWCRRQVDGAAIWLVYHAHWRAGDWLWRLTRAQRTR